MIHEITTNGIVVSDMVDGYRVHRLYIGYGIRTAEKMFIDEFIKKITTY